ncbi:hypothetical protein N9N67_02895 [Bacteriovoracaceae bacterium]|nr:hypothetical protein [Bacteriovoracaceae bacterium]
MLKTLILPFLIKFSVLTPLQTRAQDVVNLSAKYSPTGISKIFILDQSEGSDDFTLYTMSINIKLVPTKNSNITQKEIYNYKDKINHCINSINPYLWSSNTESLKLNVIYNDSQYKSILKKVDLYRHIDRESRYRWALDSGCFTILHEILHFAGLVDLYDEEQYPARINMGGMYSIMGTQSYPGIFGYKEFNNRFLNEEGKILYSTQARDIISGSKQFEDLEGYYWCSKLSYRTDKEVTNEILRRSRNEGFWCPCVLKDIDDCF